MNSSIDKARNYFSSFHPHTKEEQEYYDIAVCALNFAEDFVGVNIDKAKRAIALYDILEFEEMIKKKNEKLE